MKMYSIFDLKAQAFSPPMCFETKGVAIRFFDDECARPDSRLARHPEDYDLREIGEFDPNNGMIATHKNPLPVAKAADFVKVKNV